MFSLWQLTTFHRMHVTVCKDTAMRAREQQRKGAADFTRSGT